jgi:hypothetical protein
MTTRAVKYGRMAFFFAVALISACTFLHESSTLELGDILILDGGFGRKGNRAADESIAAKTIDRIEASGKIHHELDIQNPLPSTVFPFDFASFPVIWEDPDDQAQFWLVKIEFQHRTHAIYVLTDETCWTPSRRIWEIIKANAVGSKATLTIYGVQNSSSCDVSSRASLPFTVSTDRVDAPIFFQHMPLPFSKAKSNPQLSRWLLGDISSYEKPAVVLENLPVCANCHAFSLDGRWFGMDIDFHQDKGAYAFKRLEEVMTIQEEDFISWNDFRPSGKRRSMGLFSRISPDGNYIVSTVKETSFFTMIPDLDFSQFFFPVRGLIAVYDTRNKKMATIPGADSEQYVQTSPAWSPDGRYVVFARARVDHNLVDIVEDNGFFTIGSNERIDDLNQKYQIHFDLYRVPFNNGGGGKAVPLKGASHNGRSNFFPRYSPDGKWIVFTQSSTGLAIQPDSELHIVPVEGGISKRLECNTEIMNSWHSWSPNGKWLVFSSKIHTPYTQLFLTHIDRSGAASPPILLSRFSSDNKACIAPEFIDTQFVNLRKIRFAAQ